VKRRRDVAARRAAWPAHAADDIVLLPPCRSPLRRVASAPTLATVAPAASASLGAKVEGGAASGPLAVVPPLGLFLERQGKHAAVNRNRMISKAQMLAAKTLHEIDDVEFWGAQGAAGLRTYLTKKFGSIIAGWRALDRDCNGRLTFYEFCNACRRMGYHGNLKGLWRELDIDLNGYVSLVELDKEAGLLMGHFKLRLLEVYGDMLTAWQKGIDINGSGRIEEKEIEKCVKSLNFECDPKKLYRMLRSSPSKSSHGLTLEMFDADAYRRFISGDLKGLCSGANKEFIEDVPGMGTDFAMPEDVASHKPGGALAFRESIRAAETAEAKAAVAEVYVLRAGLHNAKGFRRALVRRSGSLLAAWRDALDLDGNQRITFGEFCVALERMGFSGNVKQLWEELDSAKKGFLEFEDLDKEAATLMSEFYGKLKEKHGNLLKAWIKELDTKHRGLVDEKDFIEACERIGFSGKAKRLFQCMKPSADRRTLTLRDFDTKAYRALGRGDFRMLTEGEGPSKNPAEGAFSEMSFEERQQACFYHAIRRARIAAQQQEFARTTGEVLEFVIDTPEEFEKQCIRRYGNMIQAWRQCLDWDGNGRLTFNEFCDSCRRLGYDGSLRKLWEKYGGLKKGFIAFKDLDAKADAMVSSFLNMLNERYGSVDLAWKKGFKKDVFETIDMPTLEKMCETLGYRYRVEKLFKCLMPHKGMILLAVSDLDPSCTRKRQRGEDLAEGPESQDGTSAGNSASSTEGKAVRAKLHRALKNKFGTTLAAWRALVGEDGNRVPAISFTMFTQLLQECEFSGNAKGTWKELAGERPPEEEEATLTFGQLDAEAQAVLDRARNALAGRFGCLMAAWASLCQAEWEKQEDAKKDKEARPLRKNFGEWHLDQVAFSSACSKLGVGLKQPERVFRVLLHDPGRGQRSLVTSDLRALLIGVEKDKHKEVWGDIPEEVKLLSSKQHLERMAKEHHSQDIEAMSLADLRKKRGPRSLSSPAAGSPHGGNCSLADVQKKKMVLKYGSLFATWWQLLDPDRNNLCSKAEFTLYMRDFGCRVVHNLWAELDPRTEAHPVGRGQITFKDFDPVTSEAFDTLESMLIEKQGGAKEGWRRYFELPENKPCVDEAKFVASCKRLGFQDDAKNRKLFRALLAAPGRKYITYEELWRSTNKIGTTAEVATSLPPPLNPRPKPLVRKGKERPGQSSASEIATKPDAAPEAAVKAMQKTEALALAPASRASAAQSSLAPADGAPSPEAIPEPPSIVYADDFDEDAEWADDDEDALGPKVAAPIAAEAFEEVVAPEPASANQTFEMGTTPEPKSVEQSSEETFEKDTPEPLYEDADDFEKEDVPAEPSAESVPTDSAPHEDETYDDDDEDFEHDVTAALPSEPSRTETSQTVEGPSTETAADQPSAATADETYEEDDDFENDDTAALQSERSRAESSQAAQEPSTDTVAVRSAATADETYEEDEDFDEEDTAALPSERSRTESSQAAQEPSTDFVAQRSVATADETYEEDEDFDDEDAAVFPSEPSRTESSQAAQEPSTGTVAERSAATADETYEEDEDFDDEDAAALPSEPSRTESSQAAQEPSTDSVAQRSLATAHDTYEEDEDFARYDAAALPSEPSRTESSQAAQEPSTGTVAEPKAATAHQTYEESFENEEEGSEALAAAPAPAAEEESYAETAGSDDEDDEEDGDYEREEESEST